MDSPLTRVRAQFEALLFEPMLQPMQSAFGEYCDIAAQSFTRALATMFERGHD